MSAEYADGVIDSKVPVKPTKPKVSKIKGAWVLNTGLRYVVIHDTWGDAMKHAERIWAANEYHHGSLSTIKAFVEWVRINGA